MAKRIDRSNGITFADGKAVTQYREYKPDDYEPWTAADNKKARTLLERHYPDADFEDSGVRKAMILTLIEHIGQDWESIADAITEYANK